MLYAASATLIGDFDVLLILDCINQSKAERKFKIGNLWGFSTEHSSILFKLPVKDALKQDRYEIW